MRNYEVVFTKEFVRAYEKLDRSIKERIHQAIDKIQKNPHSGKRLTGVLVDRWSYRSGDYRILYKIYQDRFIVLALTVGHRREIYR